MMNTSTIMNLRDTLLILVGIAVSLFVVWNGIGMLLSPRRFLERFFKGFVEPGSSSSRSWRGILVGLNWRIGGVGLSIGGMAFLLALLRALGTPPDIADHTGSSSGKTTILVAVLMGGLGLLELLMPDLLVQIYERLLMPGQKFGESGVRHLRLRIRILGVASVIVAASTIYMLIA